MNERSLSLIMLIAIAFFAAAILMIPNKHARQAYANHTSGNRSSEQPSDTGGITAYAIPLAKTFNIPIDSSSLFLIDINDSR